MAGVRGIVLDSSVLLPSADDEVHGDAGLRSGAEFLLRKLRYCNIPIVKSPNYRDQITFFLRIIFHKSIFLIVSCARKLPVPAICRCWLILICYSD